MADDPPQVNAALAVTLFTKFAFGKKAFWQDYICVIAVLAMTTDDTAGDPVVNRSGPA